MIVTFSNITVAVHDRLFCRVFVLSIFLRADLDAFWVCVCDSYLHQIQEVSWPSSSILVFLNLVSSLATTYLITPFTFCSKSQPQFTHLYRYGSKDTRRVSDLHSGQLPVTICDVSCPILAMVCKLPYHLLSWLAMIGFYYCWQNTNNVSNLMMVRCRGKILK